MNKIGFGADDKFGALALARMGFSGGVADAIKALFAGGKQGVWLDPSDLSTMFKDAVGTQPVTANGDPVGLILDKSQDLDSGLDIANTKNLVTPAAVEGSSLNKYSYSNDLVVGSTYLVSFEVVNYTGTSDVGFTANSFDAVSNGTRISSNGKCSCIVIARNNAAEVYTRSTSNTASFKNMTIKELKGNHVAQTKSVRQLTYRTDGVLHWLETDAVDDCLQLSLPSSPLYQLWLSINNLGNQGNSYLYDFRSTTEAYSFSSTSSHALVGSTVGYAPTGKSLVPNTAVNGVFSFIIPNAAATTNARLFGQTYAGETMKARIYGVILIKDPSTNQPNLIKYLDSKRGV